MFAGPACPFDDFAASNRKAVVDQTPEAAVVDPATNNVFGETERGEEFRWAGLREECSGNELHASEAFFNDVERVDDVEIDAASVQVRNDGGHFCAALRNDGFPGLRCRGRAVLFAEGFDQDIARAGEPIKRRLLDGTRIAANAQFFGEPKPLDTGAEQAEGFKQRGDGLFPRFRNLNWS